MKPPFHFWVLKLTAILVWIGATCQAQSVQNLLASGDAFERTFQTKEALDCYLPAEKLEPDNVQILLRIARQYRHLMTDASTHEAKLKHGKVSLSYAGRAASLAPKDSEAQLSAAITYGKMLPFESSKEQVTATPKIKEAADKALALDPRNDIAWHVLGRWHQVLTNISLVKRMVGEVVYGKLPPATNEEAIRCFERAIAINPQRLRHYIELGRTYAQMGKSAEARKSIEKGLSMPNVEKDDADLKQRGRETLEKLR